MGVFGSVWMSGIELWTLEAGKANENVDEMYRYDQYVNEN